MGFEQKKGHEQLGALVEPAGISRRLVQRAQAWAPAFGIRFGGLYPRNMFPMGRGFSGAVTVEVGAALPVGNGQGGGQQSHENPKATGRNRERKAVLPQPEVGGGAFERLVLKPNVLQLSEARLREVAADIRTHGLNRDQLLQIYNERFVEDSPVHPLVIERQLDRIKRLGGDAVSFNRGVALAYHLVDEASAGGAPVLGINSLRLVGEYASRPDTPDALQVACDRLLGSQIPLSQAFNEAFVGLPKGTNSDMARFGGGYLLLGEIAAAQFGGTGTEASFETK